MRYHMIREIDIANGEGIRTSLFVQGCTQHCLGCFNPETWDFNGGSQWTENTKNAFLEAAGNSHIDGITILGGEPLHKKNVHDVLDLLVEFKRLYPDKTVWVYTGRSWDDLMCRDVVKQLLEYVDVLVEGAFVETLKDIRLKFRGSSNQRIIDVQKSLVSGTVVLYNLK